MNERNVYQSSYLKCVKDTLNGLGLSNYWISQRNTVKPALPFFKRQINQRLRDQYQQEWHAELNSNELFYNYRMYKQNFQYEEYLNLLPENLAINFMKFRLLNHKLPIQKGRFLGIERNERLCEKCNLNELGDEFHYIFVCPFFLSARKRFLKPYYRKKSKRHKV